jgi:hypothetical protein
MKAPRERAVLLRSASAFREIMVTVIMVIVTSLSSSNDDLSEISNPLEPHPRVQGRVG